MSPNLKAFLDSIAWSEIGPALLAASDNGYNVLVGSTPTKPLLFSSYVTHPRQHDDATNSDAAGRYQIMGRYYNPYCAQLHLTGFGHDSQDAIAIQMIRECHALDDTEAGRFEDAVYKCRSRWASFPAAGYGQHENKLADLKLAYESAGGKYWAAQTTAVEAAHPVEQVEQVEQAASAHPTSILSAIFGLLQTIFGKKGSK